MRPAPVSRIWRLYRRALRLLPEPFRGFYADQIYQTAQDEAREEARSPLALAAHLAGDLGATWVREEARMLRVSQRLLFVQAICLSAIAFVVALGGYVVMQQTVRRGANQPQLEMAATAVERLGARGLGMRGVCEASCIDIANSLQPFVIVFDESGRVLTSDATLGGRVPVPPRGVLEAAKRDGRNVLTWQPRRSVRLAIVVQRFADQRGSGYVLAGRSLAMAEQGEWIARQCALWGWVAIVLVLMGSAALFGQIAQPPSPQDL
jgi:hypothetical protein